MPLGDNPSWLGVEGEDQLLGKLAGVLGDAAPTAAQWCASDGGPSPKGGAEGQHGALAQSALLGFSPEQRRRLFLQQPGLYRFLGGALGEAPEQRVHPFLAAARALRAGRPHGAGTWPLWRLCAVAPDAVGVPRQLPSCSYWHLVRRLVVQGSFSRARRRGAQSFLTVSSPATGRLWVHYAGEGSSQYERTMGGNRMWRYVHLRHLVRAALTVTTPALSPVRAHLESEIPLPGSLELRDWAAQRDKVFRLPSVAARVRALWQSVPKTAKGNGMPRQLHEYVTRSLLHSFLPGLTESRVSRIAELDWDFDVHGSQMDEADKQGFLRMVKNCSLCYCETTEPGEFIDFIAVLEGLVRGFNEAFRAQQQAERALEQRQLMARHRSARMRLGATPGPSSPTGSMRHPPPWASGLGAASSDGHSLDSGAAAVPLAACKKPTSGHSSMLLPPQKSPREPDPGPPPAAWRSLQAWLKEQPTAKAAVSALAGTSMLRAAPPPPPVKSGEEGAKKAIQAMTKAVKTKDQPKAGPHGLQIPLPRPQSRTGMRPQLSGLRQPQVGHPGLRKSPSTLQSGPPVLRKSPSTQRVEDLTLGGTAPSLRQRRLSTGSAASSAKRERSLRARQRWFHAGGVLGHFRAARHALASPHSPLSVGEGESFEDENILGSSDSSAPPTERASSRRDSAPEAESSSSSSEASLLSNLNHLDLVGRYPPLFPPEHARAPCVLRHRPATSSPRLRSPPCSRSARPVLPPRVQSAQPRQRYPRVDAALATRAAQRGCRRMLPCTPGLLEDAAAAAPGSPPRSPSPPRWQALGGAEGLAPSPAAVTLPGAQSTLGPLDADTARRWNKYALLQSPPRSVFLSECSALGMTPAPPTVCAMPADAQGWAKLRELTVDALPDRELRAALAVAAAAPNLQTLTVNDCHFGDAAGAALVAAAAKPRAPNAQLTVVFRGCHLCHRAAEWVLAADAVRHGARVRLERTQMPPLLQRRASRRRRPSSGPGMRVD